MTIRSYRLMETHQRVDEALRLEGRRRWPDMFKIIRLKKVKLAIRDRLTALTVRRAEYPA